LSPHEVKEIINPTARLTFQLDLVAVAAAERQGRGGSKALESDRERSGSRLVAGLFKFPPVLDQSDVGSSADGDAGFPLGFAHGGMVA